MSPTWQIMLSSLYRDSSDNRVSLTNTRTILKWFKCCWLLSKSPPYLCPPSPSTPSSLPTSPSSSPSATLRWLSYSTGWSGEAHLWAYLAPPESSKHSFLWLSVWWRRAAMWNTAQHQQHSQQWKYSWFQGCESPLFFLFSLPSHGTMLLLLNLPHIDLEVMLCAIRFFSLSPFQEHVYICSAHVQTYYTVLFSYCCYCSKMTTDTVGRVSPSGHHIWTNRYVSWDSLNHLFFEKNLGSTKNEIRWFKKTTFQIIQMLFAWHSFSS